MCRQGAPGRVLAADGCGPPHHPGAFLLDGPVCALLTVAGDEFRKDGVDWHWGRILAEGALATMLGVSSELAVSDQGSTNGNVVIALRSSAQDTTNQVGQEITRRNLSIQPTLTVKSGFPMDVMVSKDLVLRPYQPLFFQSGPLQ